LAVQSYIQQSQLRIPGILGDAARIAIALPPTASNV